MTELRPIVTKAAPDTYDVAILGAGMAGAMLGAVLARNGVKVLLIDAGTHPRFAVGESTTPHTSVLTHIIADRYGVPEITPLASFEGIKKHVSSNCGQKQNFGFVFHREGSSQRPEQTNQLLIPVERRTETHLFRQDIDAYLYAVALKYGAHGRQATRIADIDIDTERGVLLRAESGERFRASYLVDAGGFRSPLAEALDLRESPTRARHHSRCLFTHMIGVKPYDDAPSARLHEHPNPWHHGTLHHVFEGGWFWVIPFDNNPWSHNPLCSVGLTLDPRVHPKPEGVGAQEEFDSFLERFPQIAWQFKDAVAARPWVSSGRLQYSAKRLVGDRYCLTSHAAGFIDALYSRGLTNSLEMVNALGWRLIEAAGDGDWSTARFEYLEPLQQGLFDIHDDLVFSSFVGFKDYELWNAAYRTWAVSLVLGTLLREGAYYEFQRGGDDEIFRGLERLGRPGSPFPVSEGFSTLGPNTREICLSVAEGSLDPGTAARRLFSRLRGEDYIPPSFGLHEPDRHWFSPTRGQMADALEWTRSQAPAHIRAALEGSLVGPTV